MFDSIRLAVGLAIWSGVCAWALGRGRAPERLVGAVMLIGAMLTPLVQYNIGQNHVELGIFAVDTAVLVLITVVALRWARWWAVYCAAFHLCQELTHVVRFYNAEVSQFYYATAAIFWSYAGLFSLAYGVGQIEWLNFKQWRGAVMPLPATPAVATAAPVPRERVDHH